MKIAAIYSVWADWDILKYSLKNVTPLVDGVIIVGSEYSNFGEFSHIPVEFYGLNLYIYEPKFKNARDSETDKRNFGLGVARNLGFTHFLTIDSDEMYEANPFLSAVDLFKSKPDLQGLVCNCQTYFKSPKLTIGLDTTLVPFIHKLTPTIRHEFNKNYPFAWEGRNLRIDPTRSLNINKGVERTDLIMHHMSWVRKDYQKKIRNSTAKANLERSTILNDLVEAKEGGFCQYYGKPLVRATVDFNIPEYEFDEGGNATIRKDL